MMLADGLGACGTAASAVRRRGDDWSGVGVDTGIVGNDGRLLGEIDERCVANQDCWCCAVLRWPQKRTHIPELLLRPTEVDIMATAVLHVRSSRP